MQALPLRVDPENTNPYEDWYMETHGGTGKASWEEDEDLPEEDDYSEQDQE